MSKQKFYKLAKKPSVPTGLKKQYYVKDDIWNSEGTLFTAKQLLKLFNRMLKHYSFESTDEFPEDWVIEEFFISFNTTSDIKNFIKFKSSKPILKDN